MIGILAVLATTAVIVLNPAERLKQARDSTRLSDINTLNSAILFYQTQVTTTPNLGDGETVYISLPDSSETCGSYTLPSLPIGWSYQCATEADYRKIDGDGWIPIDFTATFGGSPLSTMLIDPINTVEGGLYYTYVTGSWEFTAKMESKRFSAGGSSDVESTGGGSNNNERYQFGPKQDLTPELGDGSGSNGNGGPPAWVCGDSLVDSRDGKSYATVEIGTQCWMAEHLNIGTRIDGADNQTDNGIIEKYCYDNNEANCTSDGGLYQWNEAMQYVTTPGAQGICPSGWHIPTHNEWTDLEREVCTSGTCSTDFPYDTSTTGWRGTDEGTKLKGGTPPGFNAILAGYRTTDGSFLNRGTLARIWSSVESGSSAWRRYLNSSESRVNRHTPSKAYGFSVRCLKD